MQVQRVKAHGWIIHRHSMDAGDRLHVVIEKAYDVADAGNISLWTKGHVTGINTLTGEPVEDKRPGWTVLNRGRVPVADVQSVAHEPSEFWCINARINRNRLPDVGVFDLQPGQSLEIAASKVLVCTGEFEYQGTQYAAPQALPLSTMTAVTRCIGFFFKD